MSLMIREMNEEEKPRERLMQYGVKALSNEELLSIILRTGIKNKSVKELSSELLSEYDLYDLSNISYKTLSNIKGMGKVKAVTLLASLELGKRVIKKRTNIIKIKNSYDIYNYSKYELENLLQEKFLCIYLDSKNTIITSKILFIGTVNESNIYPRDIFREAVKNNASSIILVHNHPSGNVNPSYSDMSLTNNIIKIGKTIGIKILDHIIIGSNNYYSFLDNNKELFNCEKMSINSKNI